MEFEKKSLTDKLIEFVEETNAQLDAIEQNGRALSYHERAYLKYTILAEKMELFTAEFLVGGIIPAD